jgi:hypothetical protein
VSVQLTGTITRSESEAAPLYVPSAALDWRLNETVHHEPRQSDGSEVGPVAQTATTRPQMFQIADQKALAKGWSR